MLSTLLSIVPSRSDDTHETVDSGYRVADHRERLCHTVGMACAEEARRFDASTRLENPSLPTISDSWITVGKLIANGGFNSVHAVVIRDPNSDEKGRAFACKHLRQGVMKRKGEFSAAAADLVQEAKLLNSIKHKNIVGLYATSCGKLEKAYLNSASYCLFLDRLHGTVEEKFDEWRSQGESRFNKKRNLKKRLQDIALPIAEAMEYLHKHRILFRDLKPANMGYAEDLTTVVLFDFGLAKELTPTTRKLTGCTGSRRYMAPEVALRMNYGLPADAYSFGIFLHECCSLLKPFENINQVEHTEYVAKGKLRPTLSAAGGSSALQQLISKSWQRNPRGRPTFTQIVQALRAELSSDEQGKVSTKPQGFRNIFRRNNGQYSAVERDQKHDTAGLVA